MVWAIARLSLTSSKARARRRASRVAAHFWNTGDHLPSVPPSSTATVASGWPPWSSSTSRMHARSPSAAQTFTPPCVVEDWTNHSSSSASRSAEPEAVTGGPPAARTRSSPASTTASTPPLGHRRRNDGRCGQVAETLFSHYRQPDVWEQHSIPRRAPCSRRAPRAAGPARGRPRRRRRRDLHMFSMSSPRKAGRATALLGSPSRTHRPPPQGAGQ